MPMGRDFNRISRDATMSRASFARGKETDYRSQIGFKSAKTASNAKSVKQERAMEAEHRQRLEALPGWSWDRRSEKWEEGYSHLKMYSDREGHCRVPHRYKTDDGYLLGRWTEHQRETKASDRWQRLEALPGWVWKVTK